MNAINRPIDILLNTEPSPGRAQDRSSDVTGSEKKKNSFDSVLSVKQKEARDREVGSREAKPAEHKSPSDLSQADRREKEPVSEGQESESGNEKVENGKPLPQEKVARQEGAAPKQEETKELLDLAIDTRSTEDPKVIEELEGDIQQGGNSGQESEPESVIPITGMLLQDSATEQGVAGQQASTIQGEKAGWNLPRYSQPFIEGRFAAQENQKQSSGMKPDRIGAKPALELNLNSRIKVDGAAAEWPLTKELSLGQELKQWLGDNKAPADISRSGWSASVSQDTGNAVLRTHGLTQVSQNLIGLRSTGVSLTVPAAVSSANWGQAVAQRVAWLASNGVQSAELQLNPPELGPVEVKISVTSDQTNINFSSQHASVREALELSVHRLREMLESNGLNLADVDVSDQSLARDGGAESEGSEKGVAAGMESGEEELNATARVSEQLSLVDDYA